jgi:hypothetical protein
MNQARKLVNSFDMVQEVAGFFEALSEKLETSQVAAGVDAKKLAEEHYMKIPKSLRDAKAVLAESHSSEDTQRDGHADKGTSRRLVIQPPHERPVEQAPSPSPETTEIWVNCFTVCTVPTPFHPKVHCFTICITHSRDGNVITVHV